MKSTPSSSVDKMVGERLGESSLERVKVPDNYVGYHIHQTVYRCASVLAVEQACVALGYRPTWAEGVAEHAGKT